MFRVNRLDVESLKPPCMNDFCDIGQVKSLWVSTLLDPTISHCHLQGPPCSGKTFLLEATLDIAHAMNKSVAFLTPDHFTHNKLLEVDFAEWFFLDDLEQLSQDEQTVFIAWLNQCLLHGCKVLTTSGMLPVKQWRDDLSSRIQSAFILTLAHPENDAQWEMIIVLFFKRHYIHVPSHIITVILQVTSRNPQKIFSLMNVLAHQPLRLTASRIRNSFLAMQDQ